MLMLTLVACAEGRNALQVEGKGQPNTVELIRQHHGRHAGEQEGQSELQPSQHHPQRFTEARAAAAPPPAADGSAMCPPTHL